MEYSGSYFKNKRQDGLTLEGRARVGLSTQAFISPPRPSQQEQRLAGLSRVSQTRLC